MNLAKIASPKYVLHTSQPNCWLPLKIGVSKMADLNRFIQAQAQYYNQALDVVYLSTA